MPAKGRLSAVLAALLALMGSLRDLATGHGWLVQQVSPLKRRSIASVSVKHVGVGKMVYTTGSWKLMGAFGPAPPMIGNIAKLWGPGGKS